jgi:hypothetical protein
LVFEISTTNDWTVQLYALDWFNPLFHCIWATIRQVRLVKSLLSHRPHLRSHHYSDNVVHLGVQGCSTDVTIQKLHSSEGHSLQRWQEN